MNQQGLLSTQFNMSLGLSPVLLTLVLCEFMAHEQAIYIGAATGMVASLCFLLRKGAHVPRIMLFSTTAMLVLLALLHLPLPCPSPEHMHTITLEIAALVPPVLILLNRRRLSRYFRHHTEKSGRSHWLQGIEASIVSSRVVLLIGGLHLLTVATVLLVGQPMGALSRLILFRLLPPLVFLVSILFNQYGIHYFNRTLQEVRFLPIVTPEGNVIGKIMEEDVVTRKYDYTVPIVRVAVSAHDMLYLTPRPDNSLYDPSKQDVLAEDYLLFGETLEQGAERIVRQVLPDIQTEKPRFVLHYHLENEAGKRMVYLFLLELQDDAPLRFNGGKLWTFQQLEQNLGHDFFSRCLEHEQKALKATICTTGKYKES